MDDSELVLVWAPRGRDATLAVKLVARHGLRAQAISGVEELVARMHHVGCAVLTTDVLHADVRMRLVEALAAQPAWSDFPFVLFGPRGVERADQVLATANVLGNVSILERPVNSAALISTLVAVLRGRRRQYEARDAIVRRDEFLAMLGHELRNPLAAISLAVEMLPPHEPAAKQHAVIARQTRHLGRLVDDLLDVARVASGKVRVQLERVDLGEIAGRCVLGAELAARARRIDLALAPLPGPLPVDGDLVRLEEVFNNLIGNAIKYSHEGGHVSVAVRRDGAHVIAEVTDRGIGIAPEMLPRVFDLFAQADASLARSQGGLGIGLTLVRAIVELHHGTVEVRSPGLGRGTTFTVRLPLATAATATTTQPEAASASGCQRVLLVDDNEDVLEMSRAMLEASGFEVETACDGAEAVERLVTWAPDIAFVDIGLPTVDGYAVARSARARGVRSYLVAITGYGQPDDKQRAVTAGFDQHLTKPVSMHQMLAAVGAGGSRAAG